MVCSSVGLVRLLVVMLSRARKPLIPSVEPKQAVSWVKLVSAFVHSALNAIDCPRAAMDKVDRVANWRKILRNIFLGFLPSQ